MAESGHTAHDQCLLTTKAKANQSSIHFSDILAI